LKRNFDHFAMNATTKAANQPLPLQRRPELESCEIVYRRQCYWSVKDPLSLRYFQLRDEEHFILSLLDGRTSLETVQQQFQERFAPRRIELAQLNWFLGMLHREGLVVSDATEQGQQLIDRRRRTQRKQFWSSFSNLLAIRFRGIDPSTIVEGLYPLVRWAYSPWCVSLMCLLMFGAASLLLLELPTVLGRLPTFGEFFTVHNVVWMAIALAIAKGLHELGHAITCRHFGGQCRELGVMLLVFTPCLYCNVSDAWMIPNKWRRMAISAAGIYVELVLASACLILWWFSEPGAFNVLCLNLVFVCSVGTVLFNGNPLLRYDGYFIFADWCEIPNLAQRGGQFVRDRILHHCAGIESNAVAPTRGERPLLVSYTIASWIYRVFILMAILWFCHAALKPYGLQSLAIGLAIITVGGMLVMPLSETVAVLRDPARRRKFRWTRLALVSTLACAAVTGLVTIPIPLRVVAPVVLEPSEADPVYVTAPGRLVDAVREGDHVVQGQVIARLSNAELERDVAQLAADLAVQKIHVQTLTRRQSQDAPGDVLGSGGQLPAAVEALADLENRLQERLAEQNRLTLRAPGRGTVLPPRPTHHDVPVGELAFWSGTPLEARNRGGSLDSGTPVCLIGDPDQLVAQLIVDQSVISLVRLGQQVRIRVDEVPDEFLTGTVTEIARQDSPTPLPELVAKNLIPVSSGSANAANLTVTSYRVRVDLDPHAAVIPLRASGRAVIFVEPRTLGRRGYEFLCRTFRLEL
jgi:putative peptide zinc metalloprotease protein